MSVTVAVALGVVLLITHYASDAKRFSRLRHRAAFVSLTAGIFLTYIFLDLLPALYQQNVLGSRVALLFALAGFSVFHLMEKYVYQHEHRREYLRRELKQVHALAFFLYHFGIGVVLLTIAEVQSIPRTVLFFIPLLSQSVFSNTGIRELHLNIRESLLAKALLSGSTLLGVLVAIALPVTALYQHVLLGFVVGALLYVTILDAVPKERKGRPLFFVLGVVLYMVLIVASWGM